MNNDSLENLLLKVSLQSIKDLFSDTLDPITAQERIEHLAFMRPILGITQLIEVCPPQMNYLYIIKFGFSPNFLYKTRYSDNLMHLEQLYWLMKIPFYECNEEPGICDEEGLAEWLSRSQIEILGSTDQRHKLTTSKLLNSVKKFERFL
jgi:hypothetical protein